MMFSFPSSRYAFAFSAVFAVATMPVTVLAEKAGYEFFDVSHGQSLMMKDVSLQTLLIMAPNDSLFNSPRKPVEAIGRLIDIEVESPSENVADFKCSAVVLDNDENYARKSWLMWNITASELKDAGKLLGWMPIDIERYYLRTKDNESVLRYAAIFAECPEKHDYRILIDATEEEMEMQVRENRRPIEIDSYEYTVWSGEPQTLDNRYNAVFVDNHGDNEVETVFLYATFNEIQLLRDVGYQLIDFEYLTYNQQFLMNDSIYGHVVMVDVGSGAEHGHHTADDIHDLGWEAGLRLIDLETTSHASSYAVFAHQDQ